MGCMGRMDSMGDAHKTKQKKFFKKKRKEKACAK